MDTEYTFKPQYGVIIARVYGRSGSHDVLLDIDDASLLYRFESLCVVTRRRTDDKWACHYVYGFERLSDGTLRRESLHHAVIGDPPDGMVTDHINGNGLDNRRRNLRHVSQAVNAWNKDPRFLCHKAPHFCPGVHYDHGWYVLFDRRQRGRFDSWMAAAEQSLSIRASELPECRQVLMLDVMRAAYECAEPGSEPYEAASRYLAEHRKDLDCLVLKASDAANLRIPPSVLAERGPDPLAFSHARLHLAATPNKRDESRAMVRNNRYVMSRRPIAPNAGRLN